jgi:hypothetical protein
MGASPCEDQEGGNEGPAGPAVAAHCKARQKVDHHRAATVHVNNAR